MGKSIGQEIKTSIENLDYNAVCRLTQYVKDSFASIDVNTFMKFRIQFNMGEVQLVIEDFDEFCTTAYGQGLDVVSVQLSNYPHRTYVHIHKFNSDIQQKASLKISCEDIHTLTQMVIGIESRLLANRELLRIQKQSKVTTIARAQSNTSKPKTIQPPITTQVVVNVRGDLNMNSSTIGSNNKVKNEGAVSSTVEKTKDVKQEDTNFWSGVWKQIVANWIWWILGIIGAGILTYLGLA